MKRIYYPILFILFAVFFCSCEEEKECGLYAPCSYPCYLLFVDETGDNLVEALKREPEPLDSDSTMYSVLRTTYTLTCVDDEDPRLYIRSATGTPDVLVVLNDLFIRTNTIDDYREISYTLQYPQLFGDEAEHTLTTYHENRSCFQISLDGQTYQPDSAGVFRITLMR